MNKITFASQVRGLPSEAMVPLKKAYADGEVTLKEILDFFHEQRLIYKKFKNVNKFGEYLRKYWGFKQREQQSHGFLADSEEHMLTWDYDKNSKEGLNPEKLTLRSNKSAWFLCPTGKHESEKREICSHTRGNGCSKCMAEAKSVPKPGRSLLEVYPLVAAEFEAGGNELAPSDVAAKSNKVIGTFSPSCGNPLHRPYKQRVDKRTTNEDLWIKNGHYGSWCPWCSNEMESTLHGKVCEYISSLIPLESGIDALVNQMVLPDDPDLEEGERQPNEIDFLSWDLGLAIEIHGHHHKYDPEGYSESKKRRAEELGLDFYVIWEKDLEIPETQEYLKEQLKVIVGFKVMAYLKKQTKAVSGTFWNGSDAA